MLHNVCERTGFSLAVEGWLPTGKFTKAIQRLRLHSMLCCHMPRELMTRCCPSTMQPAFAGRRVVSGGQEAELGRRGGSPASPGQLLAVVRVEAAVQVLAAVQHCRGWPGAAQRRWPVQLAGTSLHSACPGSVLPAQCHGRPGASPCRMPVALSSTEMKPAPLLMSVFT